MTNASQTAVTGRTDPTGQVCDKCKERPATQAWGDLMTVNHGGGEWRCDICALTEQLEFARQRAAVIPDLEARLKEANAKWFELSGEQKR